MSLPSYPLVIASASVQEATHLFLSCLPESPLPYIFQGKSDCDRGNRWHVSGRWPHRRVGAKREKIPSGTGRAQKMEQEHSQDRAVVSAQHSCGDTAAVGQRGLAQPLLTAMVPDEFLLSVLVLLLVCLRVSAHSLFFQRRVEITIHSANKHLESPHKHKGCLL